MYLLINVREHKEILSFVEKGDKYKLNMLANLQQLPQKFTVNTVGVLVRL